MPVSTCPSANALERLFQEGVPEAEATALEKHVLDCRACALKLKGMLPAQDTLETALAGKKALEIGPVDPAVAELTQRLKSLRPGAHAAHQGIAMLTFTCPSCQKNLSVKEALAGKQVKCPGCGQVIAAPAKTAVAPAAAAPAVTDPRGMTEIAPLPPSAGAGSAAEKPMISPVSATDSGKKPTYPPSSTPGGSGAPEGSVAGHDSSLTDFLAPPQAPDELGRLGKYRILKVLGHGGMGVVFQAEDPKLKRAVAIKAMLPALAASASAGKRFLREAEAMAAVEHDHVVRIYQVDEDRGVPFLAMEFLKGEPLESRLEREEKLPIPEILRIGREVAEALAAAHATGLIHRDIKPGNIWLEAPRTRVKILDFGLARAAQQEAGLTQQGAIVGTPAYMAPEQARGDKIDARCDLFSLGVVLYRISTGQQPFRGTDTISTLMSVAMHDPPPPVEVNAEVPAALSDLVMKMLEKDPAQRIGSAHEVVEALLKLEKAWARAHEASDRTEALPFVAAAKTPAAPATKSKSRRGLMLAAALAGVIALLAVSTVFFWQSPNGLVRIEIDDDEIEATLTKTGVTLKKADDGKEISLSAGTDHRIKVTRGNDFSFETSEFVLKKGDKITVSVKRVGDKVVAFADGKEIGEKTLPQVAFDPPVPLHNAYALEFDGNSKVTLPIMPLAPNQPFTLEAWAEPPVAPLPKQARIFTARGNNWLGTNAGALFWTSHLVNVGLSEQKGKLIAKQPSHVASVFTGKELILFADGKVMARKEVNFGEVKANEAAPELGLGWLGRLREARISRSPRYDKDFTPAKRFETDGDTLALYHCDEGSGDKLIDSSGNGHHGKIVGAKWVKADGPLTAPPGPNFALRFDGTSTAILPKIGVDVDAPFTVEAYVTPEAANGFVMRWTSSEFHLRINAPGEWAFVRRGPRTYRKGMVELNKRVHVAGVYDGNEIRIYVDGKSGERVTKIGEAKPTNQKEITLGANGFVGIIGEVRISKVARYDKDFNPVKRFEPDKDTLALYHFDEGAGDVFADSSGNGHHGKIVGAKWVTVDEPATTKFTNALGMEFALVPKGKAWLTNPAKGPGVHEIEMPNDFYLGVYEVTQEEWERVTRENPSGFSRNGKARDAVKDIPDQELRRFPVDSVSWDDVQVFLKVLNEKTKEMGWTYRLPTELEWEYACRGGPMKDKSESAFGFYFDKPTKQLLPDQARFKDTKPCKVGSYQPNRLGLYDMHGNLWEWCEEMVIRGGAFRDADYGCSATSRYAHKPSERLNWFGLRAARVSVGALVLGARPSPFDKLRREDIPPELLKLAGGGDPAKAPPELVAALGSTDPNAEDGIMDFDISSDGKLLALSVANGKSIRLVEIPSLKEVRTIAKYSGGVRPRFSPDGKLVAAQQGKGRGNAELVVWRVEDGDPVARFKTPEIEHGQSNFAFSPDGKFMALGTGADPLKVYRMQPPFEEVPLQDPVRPGWEKLVFLDERTVLASDWTTKEPQSVQRWDVTTGKRLEELPLGTKFAHDPERLPPGNRLVFTSAYFRGFLLYDMAGKTGKWVTGPADQGKPPTVSAVPGPDGRWIACRDNAGEITVMRLTDGHTLRRIDLPMRAGDGKPLWHAAFRVPLAVAPDGRHLVTFNPVLNAEGKSAGRGVVFILRLNQAPDAR
jgi:formylglycine-generating enzyme required for sulfatase activity